MDDRGVTLAWASTEYGLHEPDGAVVLLDVVVRNATDGVTQATSIEWEPPFAGAYEVIESDPPAWRVHRSEDGWGVLDTSGVTPGEDGHFRIWFGPAGDSAPAVEAPRVRVIADGHLTVGEGVANPTHAAERAKLATQLVFEQGGLALAADYVSFVPASATSVFPVVVALAVILTASTVVGLAAIVTASARSS